MAQIGFGGKTRNGRLRDFVYTRSRAFYGETPSYWPVVLILALCVDREINAGRT